MLDRRLDDKLDGMKEKQDELNDKLNTLMGMMEKKKTKYRHQQKDDSDMLCTSSNNLGSPPRNKTRRNQCYVVYPPKAKIEMSKFSGNDEQCVAWLNKAEKYFDIYNITTDIEKVKYVFLHLENHAYNWYMWWKGDNFTYTWNLFKNNFLKRFQGINEDDFFLKLTRL